MQGVKDALLVYDLDLNQCKILKDITTSCEHILQKLEQILDGFGGMVPRDGSPVGKKRRLTRLDWPPEDIEKLRSRITSNIELLKVT